VELGHLVGQDAGVGVQQEHVGPLWGQTIEAQVHPGGKAQVAAGVDIPGPVTPGHFTDSGIRGVVHDHDREPSAQRGQAGVEEVRRAVGHHDHLDLGLHCSIRTDGRGRGHWV
jgi:hypothetical protein